MGYSTTKALAPELQDAICRLEKYSKEIFKKQDTSPIKKTISLFKLLIFDKKRHQIEILRAIDIINRERLFIGKLKEGDAAEKNLAEALTKAIEAYNKSHDFHNTNIGNQNNKISKFFLKLEDPLSEYLPKIELPQEKSLKINYPEISCHISLKQKTTIVLPQSSPGVKLSKQTAELFHMKALALLERYGIASNCEARNSVKNSPIITTIENETENCTLAQQLLLFPGQIIVIKGSSQLDPKTQTINKLFPATFHVSLESTQTGFPHPSQYTGWALGNQLLPESPQRPDMLQSLARFFEQKKRVAAELLPHGSLIDKAKKLLKIKKTVYETYNDELVALHRLFVLTLLQASSIEDASCFSSSITRFYESLHLQTGAFDILIDAHQKIRDLFICRPHTTLLQTIVNETSKSLQKKHQRINYEAAEKILQKAMEISRGEIFLMANSVVDENEKKKWEYIDSLGMILGVAIKHIILQYLSEDLLYIPPILSSFECTIQTAAYKQAQDFINELYSEFHADEQKNLELTYQKIKAAIVSDTTALKLNNSQSIAKELETYFQLRYQNLLLREKS